MAIDPLLSQATSRVVEYQRGSGDEKRRQDSAASYLARPQGPGGRDFAVNDALKPREGPAPVDGRDARGKTLAVLAEQGQKSVSQADGRSSGLARNAARLARNDSRLLFASVGFAAQQLAQEGQNGNASSSFSGVGKQDAFNAYSKAQERSYGSAPSGPQVVTESGVLMGFGAFDDLARLDVTV